MIGILIPTWHRPKSIRRTKVSIDVSTPEDHKVYFILEPDDHDSAQACLDAGVVPIFNNHKACYAGAINAAFEQTEEQFLFIGADDLNFHHGWLTTAMGKMMEPGVYVVGTNDLLNPYVLQGHHATHYLVDRAYIDTDGGTWEKGPGIVMYEELDHQYSDTCLIGIAKARGRFVPCLDSIVEHLHFTAGKSDFDETYERAYRENEKDRAFYLEKKKLWYDKLPVGDRDDTL